MVGNYMSLIWSLFSDLWLFMKYIFSRSGINVEYLIIGMVIVTALFNYVLSPFLKGSGFLSGSKGSSRNSKKSSQFKGDSD